MDSKIKKFIADNTALMYKTLKELCEIPAPSHFEAARAEYCKNWLESNGAKGVYIDKALNVVFPLGCENSNKITVYAAHTDTVFPDTEPMPYYDDGEKIHCPGVGDDTASVVAVMLTAKFYIENNIKTKNGIMFVCNSCEEGLGNLKGTRQLFSDFKNRIESFVTLESGLNTIVDRSVGSHRYEVEVTTEGGHSYSAFGNKNAIAEASRIVNEIYEIKVPQKADTKTTYNVGLIEGGTSVNTVAQQAKILCEYRSDDSECLGLMKKEFEQIFARAAKRTDLKITVVGERPCSITEKEKIDALKNKVTDIISEVSGKEIEYRSGSTDCNIPLSLGVAAICLGACTLSGAHTREEWIDKQSIKAGLELSIKTSLALTK